MSISYWLDKSKDNNKTYDVVIVGAGIAGWSTAYWLNKRDPQLKICLLDKGDTASGATGRNAGFITCGSVEHFNRLVGKHGQDEANEIWQFSESNLKLLKEEIIKDDETLEFNHKGSFSLASSSSEFEELKKTAQIMTASSIEVEVLNQEQIQSRLGAIGFVGGIKYCGDASVNPVSLTEKIKQYCEVDFLPHTELFNIDQRNGVVYLQCDKFNIEADMVILATNGYSNSIHDYFADKIYPTRGQILATEPVPKFMEGPCYANFVLDYFRQLENGQLLIGGFRQLEKTTEVGYSNHTTEVIQQALYEFIQTHIPQIKDKKVTHRWGGVMGFSADGQPMIGSLPDFPQVFFVGGFTAHGLGLAFHAGRCLTDLIYGDPIPNFISARRF